MAGLKIMVVGFLCALAAANPLDPRQTCVDTCGSTCYYQSDIDAAVSQGCSYYRQGRTAGSSDYPHTYNDYEGFNFPDSKPYQEFPILHSYEVYTGGSPGADRVIFDDNCDFEGVITHTGASGNDFLQCRRG